MLQLEIPRVIILDIQKKLSQKIIFLLENRDVELVVAQSLSNLKKHFDEQSFDLFIYFEDKSKLTSLLDSVKNDNPSILYCLIGNSLIPPNIDHDLYLSKAELKTEEILENCFDNIIKIIVREKNQSELSSMLLHDLRSPTQSIIGYIELLEKGIFGEINHGQKQILRNTFALSDTLISLLEELSQVYQFERKRFVLIKNKIHLKELIDESLRSLWVQADKKNIKFVPHVSTKLPNIVADRSALQRVLLNLLTNAITYCPENETVRIFAQLSDTSTKQDMVHFRITDTGSGIPAEDLNFLFDKYFRVKRARQKSKGFGLGLYLSKLIVNAHGGQIGAYNNREGGSTFYFNLPINSTES